MRTAEGEHGQIAFDLEEFCRDYGHPAGRLFTFEITCDAMTYVYANVAGRVRNRKVVFELSRDDHAKGALIPRSMWPKQDSIPVSRKAGRYETARGEVRCVGDTDEFAAGLEQR
jgi:hypothetical protein